MWNSFILTAEERRDELLKSCIRTFDLSQLNDEYFRVLNNRFSCSQLLVVVEKKKKKVIFNFVDYFAFNVTSYSRGKTSTCLSSRGGERRVCYGFLVFSYGILVTRNIIRARCLEFQLTAYYNIS